MTRESTMNWIIGGLPVHPLLVHLAVTLLPLAAIIAAVAVFVPRFRVWLRIWQPLLGTAAFLAAALTASAGEALAEQSDRTPALELHARLGDYPVVATLVLAVLLWAQWAWYRYAAEGRTGGPAARWPSLSWIGLALNVLIVVAAVATVVVTVLAGDAGARSVWTAAGI